MIILTLLSALALSAIAGYYSIVGLASIFPGAFWPVVAMGGTLEVAKLVSASWLYRNWKIAPLFLKSYLTSAVCILMLITSMGIFGFLAKSHIDSTLNTGANTVEIRNITTQEEITQERLTYLLARAKDPSTASNRLDRQIQSTQKELTDLSKRKLPLLREENKLTVEVGPIKYVAALIYGAAEDGIERAVRLVIMIIMVVFDPLAVLLLIAANISIRQRENAETNILPDKKILENQVASNVQHIQVDPENLVTMAAVPPSKKKIESKYDHGPGSELSFKERHRSPF